MGWCRAVRQRRNLWAGGMALAWWLGGGLLWAQSPSASEELIRQGRYEEAAAQAEEALREADEERGAWAIVQIRALLEQGKYPEALAVWELASALESRHLPLKWQGREVLLANGRTSEAAELPLEIENAMAMMPRRYRDAESITAYARALLHSGTDPKTVLSQVLAVAKRIDPEARAPLAAEGELALSKHDYALAAKTYRAALEQFPDDPDFHHGLALAYAPSDRAAMLQALEAALALNPRHVPSLLRLAEHQLDAEAYEEAEATLKRAEEVNPHHPELWALRAVVAHLRHEPAAEAEARARALRFWPTNPLVDHLIGKKLSQKYRFAEGAARQRMALKFDGSYLPARAQLASDLLRLGLEEEGWQLATEVQQEDAYDVAAYNLVTLRDHMEREFATLRNDNFILRMQRHEAAVYGQRALELLEEARHVLGAKYELEVHRPVTVEIFPTQKDFGVRTFGMPDNPGYLGVCFGPVVTATSPAARPGVPINWQAVLWHEFCHVVTLQATANKMPRWLSEGISVYEERQKDPAWGEQLNPQYREMLLGEDFVPIAQLSGAFLSPRTPLHLQFAYYEASLVVEYLVSRFGLPPLQAVLRELREGVSINDALSKHTLPLEQLEAEFRDFARAEAEKLAPALEWEKPPPRLLLPGAEAERDAWVKEHPKNYWALRQQAEAALEAREWAAALVPLKTLLELYPKSIGSESAWRLLAQAHRELGDTPREREAWAALAALDDEAPDAYARLMELAAAAEDWAEVVKQAHRFLAVNPLTISPYRALAEAAEKIQDLPEAVAAWRTVAQLDPPNPAEVHYHLARLLHQTGSPDAKREVLLALEHTPGHVPALRLLKEINRKAPAKATLDD